MKRLNITRGKYLHIVVSVSLLLLLIAFFTDSVNYIYLQLRTIAKENNIIIARIIVSTALLLLNTACAYWGYKLAKKKRRDEVFWAICCFITTIWGLLFLYYSKPGKRSLVN